LTYDLDELGWTPALAADFAASGEAALTPARIAAQHKGRYVLYAETGDLDAVPSGHLRHEAGAGGFPAVGDWVAVRASPGVSLIERVLARASAFTRAAADPARPHAAARQEVVAANADLVLIVTAAHLDLNFRRLERFLAAGWQSGAEPVVVLSKIDLVPDPPRLLELIGQVAPGARALGVDNLSGEGVEELRALIGPGRTAALLGTSGVGKSSLINRLLGEARQATFDVREDGRGRHTTTARELILLPGGGLVLDTPGMRLLTPSSDAGLDAAFAEIETLGQHCRFRDCRHEHEPGCAVTGAVEAGVLAADRLAGFHKLRRELQHVERSADPLAQADQRRKWRAIHKGVREHMKRKRGGWD
jgi:ribosome biogenesis GTPase